MADKQNRNKKGNKRMVSGRKKRQCERYRLRNSREKNKARRLLRHTRKHPNDGMAKSAFQVVRLYVS